jgi:hypothetical protein
VSDLNQAFKNVELERDKLKADIEEERRLKSAIQAQANETLTALRVQQAVNVTLRAAAELAIQCLEIMHKRKVMVGPIPEDVQREISETLKHAEPGPIVIDAARAQDTKTAIAKAIESCAVICDERAAAWAARECSDLSMPSAHCKQRALEALHLAQAIRALAEQAVIQ